MPKTLPVTITLQDLENLFNKHDERLEKRILKEVRKIIKEELKSYARADRLQEAVDAIMHGMEESQKEFVKKKDLQKLYA